MTCQSIKRNLLLFMFHIFRQLTKLSSIISSYDAVTSELPHIKAKTMQIPFIGNGNIGMIADYEHSSLYLFNQNVEHTQKLATEEIIRYEIGNIIGWGGKTFHVLNF